MYPEWSAFSIVIRPRRVLVYSSRRRRLVKKQRPASTSTVRLATVCCQLPRIVLVLVQDLMEDQTKRTKYKILVLVPQYCVLAGAGNERWE